MTVKQDHHNHKSKKQVLLGFDFGTHRIGVAVGQTLTGTANALTTLETLQGKPDWSAINELVNTWLPSLFIVGLPLHMDGREQMLTTASQRFARQLEGRYQIPVEMVDERLSSVAAKEQLENMNLPKHSKQNRGTIDKIAAQVILQSWLDQQ